MEQKVITVRPERITPNHNSTDIVSGYEKATKGGILLVETRSLMEEIREEAARRVYAKSTRVGINEFFQNLIEESVGVWLEFFPRIVNEMRRANYEKMRILKEISTQGKFTESYGWSESRDFKFEYEHTPEFYFFMKNYVYEEFFSNENKRWYRAFMRRLMRGDDPMETLIWIKKRYGSNSQAESVVRDE